MVGLILIACLACSQEEGAWVPPEQTWVSVVPDLDVLLIPPEWSILFEPPPAPLFIASGIGDGHCNKYDYRLERDRKTINITWSQYKLVVEDVYRTLQRVVAKEWIRIDNVTFQTIF